MWRNVTPSNDPKFLVSGTELNNRIVPGTRSRYQLCEVRSYDREARTHDRRYAVRDAATVTDADIREGKRPAIVAWFDFEDSALNFCWFGVAVPEFNA
jgi:hypothetical protein